MGKRLIQTMTLVTGLTVVSIGPSWAFSFEDKLMERLEKAGETFTGKAIDSIERNASKKTDEAITNSTNSQVPSKSQDNQGTTSSKPTDTARPIQENPQGRTGQ